MDRRSWLWRRKSSERSPGAALEIESSGSLSSNSERFSDDQVSRSHKELQLVWWGILHTNLAMDPVSIPYYIVFAVIVTCLVIVVMFIISYYIRSLLAAAAVATTTSNNHNFEVQLPPSTVIDIGVGLDKPIIESYPKLVLDESFRLYGPNSSPCSICLCEYNTKDTIRYIPWCNHCFHVDCIDQWLQMSDRCPICRTSSPAPSSLSADNMSIIPSLSELLPPPII